MALNKFVIISNNCWGAEVYKELNVRYNTPFIGLFIPPECYVKLLINLEFNLHTELRFRKDSKYAIYNENREQSGLNYPIGYLNNDIEIHFMHYSTPDEARDKWQRRVARIDFKEDNIFIKFCDREIANINVIKEFDLLKYPYKVCFTSKRYKRFKSCVWIYENKHLKEVIDGKSLYQISNKYFDAISWVKLGNGSLSLNNLISLKIFIMKLKLKALLKKLWRLR